MINMRSRSHVNDYLIPFKYACALCLKHVKGVAPPTLSVTLNATEYFCTDRNVKMMVQFCQK